MKKTLALLLALFALPAHADIEVGLIMPLSGQYAVFGEQARRGAEQAITDLNAAGGILGQKLKLTLADDACDPKQAVTAATQMVSKGIQMVVGHYCSGSAIPASKVFMDEKVVLITPAATNPKITDEGGPGVFRTCGRDDKQGVVIGQTILKEFKDKKLAILHDKSAYGRGLAEEVKKVVNGGGVKEVMFEAFTPGEKDYSAIVTNLKKNNIEMIVMGGYHTETGLILRQLRAASSQAQMIGGDALTTLELWSIAGPAAEGLLMTFGPDPRNMPEAQAAVKALRAAGWEPEGYTLYTYAAVQAFAQAATKAGEATFAKLTPVLHNEKFKTVMGDVTFDKKGDIVGPGYVVYKWSKGKYAERSGTLLATEPAPGTVSTSATGPQSLTPPENSVPMPFPEVIVPSSGEPGKPCTMEAKICPDGSGVGRTGPNCEFAPCPGEKASTSPSNPILKVCPEDAKICPDGSSVVRIGPTCEFAACPNEKRVDPSFGRCTKDVHRCPDGSSVGRTGPNCEFAPCPAEKRQ
jgi:branched-chain amino acid transport system substrate-binding protein